MKKVFPIATILMAALLLAAVHGTTAGAPPSTELKELLELAKKTNPDILAAREAAIAAGYHSDVASGFPDPTFTFAYFLENVETRLGPQRSILQLVQPIPFPGKLSLKGHIASYEARIREERLKLMELKVLKEVKEAYFSIAAVEEALAVLSGVKDILDRFEETVRIRLETGRGYQQDILKIQIERLKLEERELNYEKRRLSLSSSLNALLNRAADYSLEIKPVESVSELPHPAEELRKMALQQPELRSGELKIEQRRRALSLARRNYLPDFTVGMSYINIGESPMDIPRSGEDAWNVSIGVRVPLWFGKVRSEIKETESMVRHLERSLEAQRARILADVEDLHNQYIIAHDLVKLYKEDLIPRAEQSLQSAEAGYISGDVDFLYLLDCERLLLELRITFMERKAEVEKKIAGIEALVGAELIPRR